MKRSEVKRIVDQLARAYDGDAWCGSSLRDALKDVDAAQAARHKLAGAHSIWEIVLHVAAWMGAVRERIEGGDVRLPAEGDWQEVTETDEAAWQSALDHLDARHQELLRAVEPLTDADLNAPVATERDPALGSGVSAYVMLHGTAQHSLYHAGQIMLLKRRASAGS